MNDISSYQISNPDLLCVSNYNDVCPDLFVSCVILCV